MPTLIGFNTLSDIPPKSPCVHDYSSTAGISPESRENTRMVGGFFWFRIPEFPGIRPQCSGYGSFRQRRGADLSGHCGTGLGGMGRTTEAQALGLLPVPGDRHILVGRHRNDDHQCAGPNADQGLGIRSTSPRGIFNHRRLANLLAVFPPRIFFLLGSEAT